MTVRHANSRRNGFVANRFTRKAAWRDDSPDPSPQHVGYLLIKTVCIPADRFTQINTGTTRTRQVRGRAKPTDSAPLRAGYRLPTTSESVFFSQTEIYLYAAASRPFTSVGRTRLASKTRKTPKRTGTDRHSRRTRNDSGVSDWRTRRHCCPNRAQTRERGGLGLRARACRRTPGTTGLRATTDETKQPVWPSEGSLAAAAAVGFWGGGVTAGGRATCAGIVACHRRPRARNPQVPHDRNRRSAAADVRHVIGQKYFYGRGT